MKFQWVSRLARRLVIVGEVSLVGLLVASIVGFLQDSTPFGDDSIYHVGTLRSVSSNFPFLAWDPHAFAGYIPAIGLSWLTYFPPLLLVKIGLDTASSFHVAFVCVFLLLGLSVYYFSRSVGSDRVVSFAVSVLSWSTIAYWNNTIWGGAYNRAFTLPFMFIALGTTFRYASNMESGGLPKGHYWLCVATWTLIYIGDVFIAIAGSCIGLIFLLLSAGRDNFVLGMKRICLVFLPPVGLTIWQIVPVIRQAVVIAPYRVQYQVPNNWASLFVPGPTWTSTLNFVYVPIVLGLTAICLLTKVRLLLTERALLVSLFVLATYWFVMGWIPPLWSYLPRLMSTVSSVDNLAWILLMAVPLLFTIIQRTVASAEPTCFRINLHAPLTPDGRKIVASLRTLTVIFVVANAFIVIPSVKPVNWAPLSDQVNAVLNTSLGAPSSDYRISLQNRALTRTFSFYQPDRFDTGGRVEQLNPNPFFNNWYMTDLFYKNDLDSISANYIEDRPGANVSSFLESSDNFAGPKFWLDWYGVNAAVFYPYSSLYQTIRNYSARPSLFSVTEKPTSYFPEILVKYTTPSAILDATNASMVGFYSTAGNSRDEFQSLVAILSSMGLGSRFIIPLYLQSIQDALTAPIDVLVTDSGTYSDHGPELQPGLSGRNVVVVSSRDGQLGEESTVSPQGAGLVISVPQSFSQLVKGKEMQAFSFVRSAQIVAVNSVNASSPLYYGPSAITLIPDNWTLGYKTPDVQGSLYTDPDTLTLNLTSSGASTASHFNIDYLLPDRVLLSKALTVRASVQTSIDITLGLSFTSTSSCCANYVAVDRTVKSGNWVDLELPYSEFNKWANSSAIFGLSRGLTFTVNLPLGTPNMIVRFTNVTVTYPGYTTYLLPREVSPANDGVLIYDGTGETSIGLMRGSNSSTAVLNLSGSTGGSIVTLASFAGGEADDQYDTIVIVGELGQSIPFLALFAESPWTPVHEEWTNHENMVASTIPRGYRGVVWKETYSPRWRFVPDSGEASGSLSYYYAGPGMVYIPIVGSVDGIRAVFVSTSVESVIFLSTPGITIFALVVLRNRLPALGRLRRQSQAEEH